MTPAISNPAFIPASSSALERNRVGADEFVCDLKFEGSGSSPKPLEVFSLGDHDRAVFR